MSAASKSTNKSVRSTDRGGIVSLMAGLLCLSLGFGLLIGISLQASSLTVVALKEMAVGLGGVLYYLLPYFFMWLGGLMCVSARHYVSFRSFLISFSFLMALLSLLVMLSSVTGFGTLMQYIRNLNLNILKVAEPDSYFEYISRAFQRYDNGLNPLPGGGALGMLLAFPIWKVLGQVGGVIFLVITMISLLFALFRINPVRMYHKFESRLQGGKPAGTDKQAASLAADENQRQPLQSDAAGELPPDGAMAFRPQTAPYYVEPWQDKNAAAPRELYAQTDVFIPIPDIKTDNTPVKPLDEGFIAVGNDYYEKFERDAIAAVKPRETSPPSYKKSNRSDPVSASNEGSIFEKDAIVPQQQEDAVLPDKSAHGEKAQTPVAAHISHHQALVEEKTPSYVSSQPAPGDEPDNSMVNKERRPRAYASSTVNEVGVAPAVPLTGQRVSVKPNTVLAAKDSRIDGTAKAKPQIKQTSLVYDAYQRPILSLISTPPADTQVDTTEEDHRRAEKLISTLSSFNITASVRQVVHGPAVTSFGIRLAEGVNINKLRNVMDNISVELLAKSPARAEIPIPGTPLIGIEVSNEKASMVYLREILESARMQELKSPSAVALGKDIYGAPVICELMDMPHLLIAGATGSGKSVCINSIITSLLYRSSPKEVRMILIDPKFVELQPYNEVPHLLLPVVVDPKKAVMALEWVCQEMDARYKTLEKYRVRNIDAYNAKLEADEETMPRIIVIVDEMADLMLTAGKAIDEHIKRITAKARAAGICLILATQRPSVDVITGIIKANIPSRIAFQVSSQVDSRTILDSQGAEKLLGYGDMLYFPRTLKAPKRVQGCFISDKDVGAVADFVKGRNQTEYNQDIMEHIEKEEKKESSGGGGGEGSDSSAESFDEKLPEAIEMAVEAGQMSISMLQRVLRVGYGRAGRLIDEMAKRNIISGNEGTKPRKTLISREEYQQLLEDEKPF